ncbi:hypothetical protein BDM02DRAFT_3112719 [Thelephora ganbajun]|uniref:Uncharacterized protein n=1 Tax=Thelephora ganbajun TaxID=370292 RepID=A0ACB6ZKP2_THEGA|nr:hypothetical protein BDM02DRAFT_3112719 [Thelephora ganbajun]
MNPSHYPGWYYPSYESLELDSQQPHPTDSNFEPYRPSNQCCQYPPTGLASHHALADYPPGVPSTQHAIPYNPPRILPTRDNRHQPQGV